MHEPHTTDDLTYERAVEVARPWGLEVRYCAETGSTNADAAAWAPLLSSSWTMEEVGTPGVTPYRPAGPQTVTGAAALPDSRKSRPTESATAHGGPQSPGFPRSPGAPEQAGLTPPTRHRVTTGGLVVAGHQTAGRGRLDRTWFSTPGASLLFSLVVRPAIDTSLLGLVPLAAGVALCRAAHSEGVAARLKWPNDLLAGGRKAGGILCETAWTAGAAAGAGPIGSAGWVVVGVGVNVNLPPDDLPDDLRATATSLSAEAGRPIDRAELLASFLGAFFPLLRTLELSGGPTILDAYIPLCDTVGAAVQADVSGLTVTGVATGIDPSGALVLDTGAVLSAGDVVHLAPAATTRR